MTKINGIDLINLQKNISERTVNNNGDEFNKFFLTAEEENKIIEEEKNILPNNKDLRIVIDNTLGKINKIENYNIQINIIPDKKEENTIEEIAFTGYMSIISSLNKITHNLN